MNHAGFLDLILGIVFFTMGVALPDPKFEASGLITGWFFRRYFKDRYIPDWFFRVLLCIVGLGLIYAGYKKRFG
jgi:putative Mn2+ efflux pump MntP